MHLRGRCGKSLGNAFCHLAESMMTNRRPIYKLYNIIYIYKQGKDFFKVRGYNRIDNQISLIGLTYSKYLAHLHVGDSYS